MVVPRPDNDFSPAMPGLERTRLSALGELSYRVGSLMELLASQDMLAQKDRIFEFPDIDPSALPEAFKKKEIDGVLVILGNLQTESGETDEHDEQTEIEISISISIRSGHETLSIVRSTDPYHDPEEVRDMIVFPGPDGDSVPLEKELSTSEVNAIIVALISGNTSSRELFSNVDFLDPNLYKELGEIMDSQAPIKGYRGIHTFADGDGEIEFSKVESDESFKITYVDRSETPPRAVAASADSGLYFGMRFFSSQALDIKAPIIPDNKDIEILSKVVATETGRLVYQMSDATQPLRVVETIANETELEAEQRIIDSKATRIALDEFLDQNRLDPPDTSA